MQLIMQANAIFRSRIKLHCTILHFSTHRNVARSYCRRAALALPHNCMAAEYLGLPTESH